MYLFYYRRSLRKADILTINVRRGTSLLRSATVKGFAALPIRVPARAWSMKAGATPSNKFVSCGAINIRKRIGEDAIRISVESKSRKTDSYRGFLA